MVISGHLDRVLRFSDVNGGASLDLDLAVAPDLAGLGLAADLGKELDGRALRHPDILERFSQDLGPLLPELAHDLLGGLGGLAGSGGIDCLHPEGVLVVLIQSGDVDL